MVRTATISRKTKETELSIDLNLDGTGISRISTGIGFFWRAFPSMVFLISTVR